MVDYTNFKKTFCDCCKNKLDGDCVFGLKQSRTISDCVEFIDWEALMDTKDSPEHDWPRCDAVYIVDNKTLFIEQKNIRWFTVNNSDQLKDVQELAKELLEKFEKSKQVYENDGNILERVEYILSYNLNSVSKDKLALLERALRNNYFPYIESKGIMCYTCDQVAYYAIFRTEFKIA